MYKTKMMMTALAGLLLLTACGGENGGGAAQAGRFFLTDQRTQMPVLSCVIPADWLAGGKTTWTTEPAQPVHWYVWALSPDQRTKLIVSSPQPLASPGRLRQSPLLRNPELLANTLLAGAQRDHNLSGIRLVEARYNPYRIDRDLLEARMRQARERGIQPTDMYSTELVVRGEGYRGGEKMEVFFSLPMLGMENRPGMGYTSILEILLPTSFSCPAGDGKNALERLKQLAGSIRMNPGFIAMINHIAEQRTANWIRIQNEIHDKQMEAAASASRTQDKVRDMWSQYIRDVDTVSDPKTGSRMLVDSRYDHAWINSGGEVIYHNSGFNTPNASTATFDPNSNALFNHTEWRKLK